MLLSRPVPAAGMAAFSFSKTFMTVPLLQLDRITKCFGALTANDDISLEVGRGEVLALLGENGAGKSTLVSILFGHYIADSGTVTVDGKRLPPGQPRAALAAGVGMVHQHFTLADNLSVLDNIMLGTRRLWDPRLGRRQARARVQALASRFGLNVQPDATVGSLSVGERQRVEIIKALYRGARLLILDEPTAVLTPQEAQGLFHTLRQLVDEGLSIVFISHKLDEVLRVSHRVAVLRGGRLVATRPAAGTSKAALAELMVGRAVSMPERARAATNAAAAEMTAAAAPPALQRPVVAALEGVGVGGARGRKARLRDIDLTLHAGEIVGVAGVAGNGQVALAEVLSGTLALDAGTVRVGGQQMGQGARGWIAAGVARVPEDRHAVGVIGDLAVWENAVVEQIGHRRFSWTGVIRRGAARRFAADLVARYDVRGAGIDAPTRALSGGNMQKLILGRALSAGQHDDNDNDNDCGSDAPPRLVIASQPTWGLDIGAVAYVRRKLIDVASQGAAVLLISEDLDELRALADRIAVMHDGRLTPARPTAEWTVAALGLAMAGADPDGTPVEVSHAA